MLFSNIGEQRDWLNSCFFFRFAGEEELGRDDQQEGQSHPEMERKKSSPESSIRGGECVIIYNCIAVAPCPCLRLSPVHFHYLWKGRDPLVRHSICCPHTLYEGFGMP